MHFRGSILLLPLRALVGQAAIQAFLHQEGQSVLMEGMPGENLVSMTTAMGRVQELPLATLFE